MSTAAPNLMRAAAPSVGGLLLFGAVIFAHVPFIGLHLHQVWPKEYYQYMPLVPIGAWFLAAKGLKEDRTSHAGSEGVRFILLSTIVLTAAIGAVLYRV